MSNVPIYPITKLLVMILTRRLHCIYIILRNYHYSSDRKNLTSTLAALTRQKEAQHNWTKIRLERLIEEDFSEKIPPNIVRADPTFTNNGKFGYFAMDSNCEALWIYLVETTNQLRIFVRILWTCINKVTF